MKYFQVLDWKDFIHMSYFSGLADVIAFASLNMIRTCQHEHKSLQMISEEKQTTSTTTPDSEGISEYRIN